MKPFHLMLTIMAPGLAACAGADRMERRGPAEGFRVLIAGEPAALDRLEKAARSCRLTGIARDRGREHMLSFDTPARDPRPGDPFACFIDWTRAHPETQYRFVGNAPVG